MSFANIADYLKAVIAASNGTVDPRLPPATMVCHFCEQPILSGGYFLALPGKGLVDVCDVCVKPYLEDGRP